MRLLLAFIFSSAVNFCSAQNVVATHEVMPNLEWDSEEMTLFDSSENKIVMGCSAQLETISGAITNTDTSAEAALILMTDEFTTLWSLSLTSGTFLNARIKANGSVSVLGFSYLDSGNIEINGEIISEEAGAFMASFDSNGDLEWINTRMSELHLIWSSMEVSSESETYLSASLSTLNSPFEFGGNILMSEATDLQFPHNVVTLKFGDDGTEEWGRILQGNKFQRLSDTAINDNGVLALALSTQSDDIEFGDQQYFDNGIVLINYSSNGEELWSNFFSSQNSDNPGATFISAIEYLGEELFVSSSHSSDSVIVDNETIYFDCSLNQQSGQLIRKFNSDGVLSDKRALGCCFAVSYPKFNLVSDDASLWHVFRSSGSMEIPPYTLGQENAFELVYLQIRPDLSIDEAAITTTTDMNVQDGEFSLLALENNRLLSVSFGGNLQFGSLSETIGEDRETKILEIGNSLSVSETKSEVFKMFPNPIRLGELLSISGHFASAKSCTVSLYSVDGKKVLEIAQPNDLNSLDLGILSKGSYIVKLNSNEFEPISRMLVID